MKTLPYPQIDNIDLWDKIVAHKHQPAKGKLLPLRNDVNLRYAFYAGHIGALDQILPLPLENWRGAEEELKSCYGKNVEFNAIRQQLFSNLSAAHQTKCPYCMLDRPNTLDHYFDKAEYPEFSVYIPNLVPCCSECNNNKSILMFDGRGNRCFIHFYHDPIPEEQFLFVHFSFSEPDAIPIVNLELKFDTENHMSGLIRRHFFSLSLFDKYREEITARLAPILEEIQMHRQHGIAPETITEMLQIRFESLVKHYGNNYWETCTYEGLLNSPGFLSRLLST